MIIGLVSLGCAKNRVDSELILGLLEQRGHRITDEPAEAEVLIVNSCGFIESAKAESTEAGRVGFRQALRHSRERLDVAGWVGGSSRPIPVTAPL